MKRTSTIVMIAMAGVAAAGGRGDAATYYVDPAGNDGDDGSAGAPLASIQAAADRVAPGDEVVVRPGVYRNADPGFLIALDRGGTAAAWVTFRSEVPGMAIIDGNGNRSSHCWVLHDGARYVRIEGFEVRGCLHAGFHSNDGAQHITYVGNHVHHIGRLCTDTTSGKVGFYQGTGAAYHTYDGNVIHDIGRFNPGENGCDPSTEYYENHDHGLYLNSSHARIVNNVFYAHDNGWPVHVYGSGVKDDIVIVNNTFAFANPHRDGHVLLTPGTSNVVIANNVFHQPRAAGVSLNTCTGISDVTIHHNLTDAGRIFAGPSCGFTITENRTATDPLLVDPAAADFRLQPGSPAIDTGLAGALVPDHDHRGVVRPQGAGIDLGAFEDLVDTGDAPDAGAGSGGPDAGGDGVGGEPPANGGCATTGGSGSPALGLVAALVIVSLRRRRRRARVLAMLLVIAALGACGTPGGDAVPPPDAHDALDGVPPPDAAVEPALVPAVDVSVWTRTLTDPDVDCLWELGYRHVIIGTQLLEVTRQQLAIALRGGMTVDLYVYLDWAFDITAQVTEAVALTSEFPQISRIWLDVEEDPAGRSPAALRALIDESIAALGDVPGGIYTGKGWWQSYLEDTLDYAEQPLWYARYDDLASLDAWDDPASRERFGGWQAPAGKQYADYHVHTCDLAVDRNIMWVAAVPSVVVDRTIPGDDGTPPPAPTGLHPDADLVVTTTYVRPTAPALREATSYELALESWSGTAFVPYWSTTRSVSDLLLYPALPDRKYRWRMRAANAHGFGPWSEWATFEFRG